MFRTLQRNPAPHLYVGAEKRITNFATGGLVGMAKDPPLNEHEPPCALPSSQPLPAVQPGLLASDGKIGVSEPDPKELVGKLTLTVLNARGNQF